MEFDGETIAKIILKFLAVVIVAGIVLFFVGDDLTEFFVFLFSLFALEPTLTVIGATMFLSGMTILFSIIIVAIIFVFLFDY